MVYHSTTTKKGEVESRCRVTSTSLFSHGNQQLVQPGENVTLFCNATESPFGKSLKFTWLKKVLATNKCRGVAKGGPSFGTTETSAFSTNAQLRFASVVLDAVLGPPTSTRYGVHV